MTATTKFSDFDNAIPRDQRMAAQGHHAEILRQTPFYAKMAALMNGGHWYDWGGYHAPDNFGDLELEYFAIRSTAALFDVSPMVKYRITGQDSETYLNRLTLRDVRKQRPGRVVYTAWCNDQGHVLDDGTLFRLGANDFRLCCQERHLAWLQDSAVGFKVSIVKETDTVAGLALQGPVSAALLKDAGLDVDALRPFDLAEFALKGGAVTISRTGFTGDLGYELWVPCDLGNALWDLLWQQAESHRMRAIGYGALNQARVEAGFITANADFVTADLALREDRTRQPDEIGLGWMVASDKPYFTGKRAIETARTKGTLGHVLVGLEVDGNEPAEGAIVYHRQKREVGIVSAGVWSPTAKRNIAIASLVRPFGTTETDDLWVEIYALREGLYHKMMKRARVVERPFVRLARRAQTPPARN